MIEEMLIEKENKGKQIDVDLEGNLVLQESKSSIFGWYEKCNKCKYLTFAICCNFL